MKIGDVFTGLANMAATRNYTSAVVGAGTALAILGVIDQDNAKGLVDGAQQFMDGLGQMIGGAKKVWIIIGPVAVVTLAKVAGLNATLTGRLKSVTSDPAVKIDGKIIVADPQVAEAVPSAKVVAAPQP